MTDIPPIAPLPPAPEPKPRRRRHWLPVLIESLLFGLVLLLALAVLLAASPRGTRGLFAVAEKLTLGGFKVGQVEGSLWDKLVLHELRVDTAKTKVQLDLVELDWQPGDLWSGQLTIDQLALGKLSIDSQPSQQPTTLPDSLTIPLAVELRHATLAKLTLNSREVLDHAAISLSSNGHYHKLTLEHASTPWFETHGEVRLDGVKPYKVGGTLALEGETDEANWQVNASLANQLDDISLKGEGSGGPPDIPPFRADFDLHLDPFAPTPYGILKSGRIETANVDLHSLSPHLPRSALNLSLSAAPQGNRVATSIRLGNALAGTWAAARLPLASLNATLLLDAKEVHIGALDAALASGKVRVSGDASAHALALAIEADKISLAQFSSLDWTLGGRIRLDGTPMQPHVVGEVQTAGLAVGVDASLAGQGEQRTVSARRISLRAGSGGLEMAGKLALGGHRAFQLDGKLAHFDPASIGKLLGRNVAAGDLNGSLQASGSLLPAPLGKLALALRDSRLNNQPLTGIASGEWHGDRISGVLVDLGLGGNRLKASGAFGHPNDALSLDFSLPNLAEVGNGFAGHLDGRLKLAGSFKRPTVEGTARAEGVHLPGDFAIAHANLAARLDASPDRPADSPVSLKLDIQGLGSPHLSIANGRLTLAGQRAAHSAELHGQGRVGEHPFDLSARAEGSLDTAGWHGRIAQLDNGGDLPFKLNAPARLGIGNGTVAVDGLDAVALGTKLKLVHAEWLGSRFAAQGDVRELSLAEWLGKLPELKHRVATDLVLAAHFDLHGDDKMAGSLWVARESGDLALLVDDPTVKPMPLKLSAARATLDLGGDRATVALDLKSAAFGNANGSLTTHFERTEKGWRPAGGAPLEGTVHAEMPALNWVGPLLGPTAAVNGKLSADLTMGGNVGAPTWFGRLKLDDFALRLPELGANWHDGRLEATLDGETAQLATLALKAGNGDINASGRMSLHDSGPEGALSVKFDHFGALTRPDRNLVVSGESNLAVQGQTLTLTGRLKADEGMIELPKRDAPVLGEDVVVQGRTERPKTQNKAPPMNLRFDLDLGDHFSFKGMGVDARLSGLVRVTASPTQRLGASGALKVEEGRYLAYGQNLSISRGIVTFQGPLDNPALDILAERKNLPLSVGVKVLGTTLVPRVSLTSDQALPDSEKLSWLVLGHGSAGTTGRSDADVLLAAADALFSAGQSVSLRQQLAGSLGLDDISVGRSNAYNGTSDTGATATLPGSTTGAASSSTNPALATRVVTLGKRLSDNAYLSYEQSLDNVGYAVKLTYQISKRISVALSAGQTSAVDVLYTWLFD